MKHLSKIVIVFPIPIFQNGFKTEYCENNSTKYFRAKIFYTLQKIFNYNYSMKWTLISPE